MKTVVLSSASRFLMSFCLIASFIVILQACRDGGEPIPGEFRNASCMRGNKDIPQDDEANILGEMCSKYLPLYRWELIAAHRQKDILGEDCGEPVPDHERLGGIYSFEKNGKGYYKGAHHSEKDPEVPFIWEFSGRGRTLTIKEGEEGKEGTERACFVVDMEEVTLVVDEPQSDGSWLRLVYKRESPFEEGTDRDYPRQLFHDTTFRAMRNALKAVRNVFKAERDVLGAECDVLGAKCDVSEARNDISTAAMHDAFNADILNAKRDIVNAKGIILHAKRHVVEASREILKAEKKVLRTRIQDLLRCTADEQQWPEIVRLL